MKPYTVFVIGILGALLFAATCIVGGLLIDGYSVTSQYISETYAIDTKYGLTLRILGHIPSGVLFTVFCVFGYRHFPPSNLVKTGFYGIALFYGIGTVLVSIFPCDSGCNKEFIDPSISQVIHNLAALLVYVFTPICILLIGLGLKNHSNFQRFSRAAIFLTIISILFVYLLLSNPKSEILGLYQRIVELSFLVWIILCAFAIKRANRLS